MKSAPVRRKVWILTAAVIVFAAIVLRFALNFRTPYPLGPDGGHDPMQTWSGNVELAPGTLVAFKAQLDLLAVPPVGYFVVGDERVPVPEISVNGNSVLLNFSEYGAEMRGSIDGKIWSGEYLRHRGDKTKAFKFSATTEPVATATGEVRIPSGDFKVRFADKSESPSETYAKFWKSDDAVFGTFIAPDGDYGLLEGTATGDSQMVFHRFTGWQATRIELRDNGGKWTGSFFAASEDKPRPFLLEAAPRAPTTHQTRMKNPEAAFEFACTSPTGELVRHTDFKGKPMIIDIMGTWCHNCLDEAPLLQQVSDRFKLSGLNVVGLSFEIRDDAKLAEKNLNLFKQRFGLTYPLLFCGDLDDANVDRRLKNQLEGFFAYPTTLFVDRAGKVQAIHSGFKGPGTREEFQPEVSTFHQLAARITQ